MVNYSFVWPVKDPEATLDYGINWAQFLALSPGDSIKASTWRVNDPGLLVLAANVQGTVAVVWVAGGVADTVYFVTNTITTVGGRVDERTALLLVRDR